MNNEPYPAFDGKCYADMDITTDSMTKIKMDFSKKTYGKNSCMYLLLCPYDEKQEQKDVVIDVSELIIKESRSSSGRNGRNTHEVGIKNEYNNFAMEC